MTNMKRYKTLQEELLDGQASEDWRGGMYGSKGLVYDITSYKEFKTLKPGCRGIVTEGKLFMCNNPYVIHLDIIHFIQQHFPSFKINKYKPSDSSFSAMFPIFLTVQKGEVNKDYLFCGESQFVKQKSKPMAKYIKDLKTLGIPFLPIDIFYDRRPKEINPMLQNLELTDVRIK